MEDRLGPTRARVAESPLSLGHISAIEFTAPVSGHDAEWLSIGGVVPTSRDENRIIEYELVST